MELNTDYTPQRIRKTHTQCNRKQKEIIDKLQEQRRQRSPHELYVRHRPAKHIIKYSKNTPEN